MRRSRRQAEGIRTGRRQASHASSDTLPSGLSAAEAYELLLPRLARLRAALATDGGGARSIVEVRRDHADLDHSLADAIAHAFAADALDAPTPNGMSSWVAEGLARSQERELALFAAADVSGVLQATTAPNPRWGSAGAIRRRPSSGHASTDTREEASPRPPDQLSTADARTSPCTSSAMSLTRRAVRRPVHEQTRQPPAAVQLHARDASRAATRRTDPAPGDLADHAPHRLPDVRRWLEVSEVQQRLGHKDAAMTGRVYTQPMRERFDEGWDRLESYVAEKRQRDA